MSDVAAQLLGEGRSLPLLNGTSVKLRYGMAELAKIEKQFGSLEAMLTELNKGQAGQIFTTLIQLLWIGQRGWQGSQESFFDQLDPRKLEDYSRLITESLVEAFPPQMAQETNEIPNPSPGLDSIGSEPSNLVELKSNSGT